MDGVHDMGGMHGFGPVDPSEDGQIFEHEWQSRVFATNLAIIPHLGNNLDLFRHRIECMPPGDYLSASYYERWLASILAAVEEAGLLSASELAEIRAGRAPEVVSADTGALPPEVVNAMANAPVGRSLDFAGVAGFAVGDRVRVRTLHRPGHTRLPRYVRGRTGAVIEDNGNQLLPDAHADRGEKLQERLYTVRFQSRDLWGETAGIKDSVCVDLWESYLEGC